MIMWKVLSHHCDHVEGTESPLCDHVEGTESPLCDHVEGTLISTLV